MKVIVFSFMLVATSSSFSQDKGVGIELDPYTFIHIGEYTIDNNIDSGDYSGFGVGVRVGASTPWLWLGLDGVVIKPSFKSNQSGVDRLAHPLADGQNFMSLGAGLAIKLGSFMRVTYTHFLDQNLAQDISSGSDSGEYKYHGKGWKAGVDLQIAEGFHLFVEKFYSNLDQYELNRTVGTLAETGGKANRENFEIDSYSIGLGFKMRFGSLGSFR